MRWWDKERWVLVKRVYCILFLFMALYIPSVFAGEGEWAGVVKDVEAVLKKGAALYSEGKRDDAKAAVSEAYFNLFEGKGMETAISIHISENRKSEIETMFGDIRGAVNGGAPAAEVNKRIDLLVKALSEDAARLPKKSNNQKDTDGFSSAFLNSFIIIMREGFEAILIIGALSAYLVKSGHKDKVKTIYTGAVIAVIASILTAILLQTAIDISGAGREALEGITMLIATAVLFYVSYWLIAKAEASKWKDYVKSKVESSLSRGNLFALSFAGFLSVYREGAETILFYQALYSASSDSGSAIMYGFFTGSLSLAGVFMAIKYGSVRIPISLFFTVTSALLYYLSFTFAGKGILELQEAEWISTTTVKGLPSIGFLGFYPTAEGMLLQSFLIAAMAAAVFKIRI